MLKNKPQIKTQALAAFKERCEKDKREREDFRRQESLKCLDEMSKIFPDLIYRDKKLWLDDVWFTPWKCGIEIPNSKSKYSLLAYDYSPVYDMPSLGAFLAKNGGAEKTYWVKIKDWFCAKFKKQT